MLKSRLCNYSDDYILAKGTVSIPGKKQTKQEGKHAKEIKN